MSHTHHDASFWTRRHPESVVLDIGDDVGALILYTSPEHHTDEIEVSLLGADPAARRVHSAVLERQLNGRTFYAARRSDSDLIVSSSSVQDLTKASAPSFWSLRPSPSTSIPASRWACRT